MKYLPNLKYIPNNLEEVTAKTPLCKGVSLGTFLPMSNLKHIKDLESRKQIVRNLTPNAHIYKFIQNNKTNYVDYKLQVVEGVYKPSPNQEIESGSSLDLATQGRLVVYELRKNGKVDIDKTVELAYYLKLFQNFYDKIILDYDVYNVRGDLNVQLIIIMPEIPEDYNVKFKKEHETFFNNNSLGSDLVKVGVGDSNGRELPGVAEGTDYHPPEIPVGENGNIPDNNLIVIETVNGRKFKLRKDAGLMYNKMKEDAKNEGINWDITSAYRSAEHQSRLFDNALKKYGTVEKARKWVAPPGKSNHGLGITVDISQMYGKSTNESRKVPAYTWLSINAVNYGFVQRMDWEPWHWEYHGDNARNVKMLYK